VSTRAAANPRHQPDVAPRPRPRTRPRPVPRREPRVRMAYVIIPLIALILGGIVLVNVAKLSLTNRTGQVIERSRTVEAETARLKSSLERRDASVMRDAQTKLGMVAPPSDGVTYLDPAAAP
jgi:hypothetical protein